MTRKLSLHRKSFQAAAWIVAVSLFVYLFDPIGLDGALRHRSAVAVERLIALYYGGSHPQGRDLAVTVGISERSLADTGVEWPPKLDFYGRVFEDLTRDGVRPSAIFLDYVFLSDLRDPAARDAFVERVAAITRASVWAADDACAAPLARIGCIRRAGGIPVVIGKPYPPDHCDITETWMRLERVAVLTPLGWPGLKDGWTPAIPRERYGRVTSCPAVQGLPAPIQLSGVEYRVRGVSGYDLTPGAALFASLCTDERHRRSVANCARLSGDRLPDEWAKDRANTIAWGSRADPAWIAEERRIEATAHPSTPSALHECEAESVGGWRQTFRAAHVGFAQFFSKITEDGSSVDTDCPYHFDLRYEQIAADSNAYDAANANRLLHQVVDGRVVVVGSTLLQGKDWITAIGRGVTPGLAMHAMAFDNLVEEHGALMHKPPELAIGWFRLTVGEMIELVLGALVALGVAEADERSKAWPLKRRLALGAALIGVALLIFAGAAIMLTVVLRWTPLNAQGLWALIVAETIAVFWEDIVVAVHGLASAGRRRVRGLHTPRAPSPEPPLPTSEPGTPS